MRRAYLCGSLEQRFSAQWPVHAAESLLYYDFSNFHVSRGRTVLLIPSEWFVLRSARGPVENAVADGVNG